MGSLVLKLQPHPKRGLSAVDMFGTMRMKIDKTHKKERELPVGNLMVCEVRRLKGV